MRLLLLVLVLASSCFRPDTDCLLLLPQSQPQHQHHHNRKSSAPGPDAARHLDTGSDATLSSRSSSRRRQQSHHHDHPWGQERQLKAVCYYTITADQDSNLPVREIDGSLCTHILVGFACIRNGSIATRGLNDSLVYGQMVGLRERNPGLKLMISLGGGDTDLESFHSAVSTPQSRSLLVQSIVQLVQRHSFDGLDVDWEFPGWSKYLDDRLHFLSLLREVRQQFDRVDRRMLLSVAVSASYTIIRVCYPDIPALARTVNFVNLMSYDMHDYSPLFPFVQLNAPLHARRGESGLWATMNTEWAARYWTRAGVPRHKLMIGIPTYSHNYILSDGRRTRPGSPAEAETFEFSYSQVCSFLSNLTTGYVFDGQAQVPYAFNGHFWSSFDDVASVTAKVKFIRDAGFGGAMTYDLNCDDFRAKCGNTRFPLQSTISRILKHGR